MKNKLAEICSVSFFLLFTLLIFRPYFLNHQIPLNGNLLLSFYQPWASYHIGGYAVGPPAKPIGFDALRIYYPTRKLVTDSFKIGKFPLWNPYQFSGNVLLATFQAAAFFPPGILFLFLPQADAWSIIVLLQPFLAACFMYLFLKQFITDKRACFLGALTFGFSAFMFVAWWEEMFMAGYAVLVLPLMLYGIEKLFQKVQVRSFLILFSAVIASLSTGWFQMILYSWIVVLCWVIFRYFGKRNVHALLIGLTTFLLALITCGLFLLPSIEAFMHSSRSITDAKGDFTTYLMPWYHIVSYVVPDFLGNPAYHNYFGSGFYHESLLSIGIVGFIFALVALFTFDKKQSESVFFTIAWIVSLSFGFSLPTSWFLLYTIKLPLLSTLQPSRIFFVSAFCASVLAAIGLQSYFKETRKKQIIISLCLILVMLVVALYVALTVKRVVPIDFEREKVSLRNLILPAVFFVGALIAIIIGWIKTKFYNVSFIMFIGITCISSLYFTQKYLYFSPMNFIFPSVPVLSELKKISGINRFLGVGDAYVDRNFAAYYGLYSPEGYDSFNNVRYSELVYSSHTQGKYSLNMPRADVLILPSLSLTETVENPYRNRMLSLLGVKYLIEKHGQTDYATQVVHDPNIKLVWTDSIFNIYENKNALPRLFFVYDYQIIHDNQKILNALYNPKTNLRQLITLEQTPALKIDNPGTGTVSLMSYTASEVKIRGYTTKNGLLMLTDSYYPGWAAFIDGKQVPILRADYSFRAIAVPAGNHEIVFSYIPNSFTYGLLISLIGIFLVGLLISLLFAQSRRLHRAK